MKLRIDKRTFLLTGTSLGLAGAAAVWWSGPPRGERDARTVAILVAAAEALVGRPIEPAHYELLLRGRLAGDEAERRILELVAARLVQAPADGTSFLQDSLEARRARLHALERGGGTAGQATGLFRRLVLALYARTDAWVHVGYESWPGTARGFDGHGLPLATEGR
jgi:hypothetical protein